MLTAKYLGSGVVLIESDVAGNVTNGVNEVNFYPNDPTDPNADQTQYARLYSGFSLYNTGYSSRIISTLYQPFDEGNFNPSANSSVYVSISGYDANGNPVLDYLGPAVWPDTSVEPALPGIGTSVVKLNGVPFEMTDLIHAGASTPTTITAEVYAPGEFGGLLTQFDFNVVGDLDLSTVLAAVNGVAAASATAVRADLNANPLTVASVTDKDGFALSADANSAIAARVEQYFLSDALGGDFKAQLVAKLNELLPELDNLSVLAIAAAVRNVLFDAENANDKLKIGENGTIHVSGVSVQDIAGEVEGTFSPLAKEATLVQVANIALDAKFAAEHGFAPEDRIALAFVAGKAAKMKFGQRFTSDGRLEILGEDGAVIYTQTRQLNAEGATVGVIPESQNG